MSEPPDDELADRVADLEETLEELRGELGPPRGPLGVPRPPTPREVLRFTDEYAIPAAIAILEANIRTLELLRAVLRGARGAPREADVRDRASSLSRTAVERVDRALDDLRSEIEDADLPRNDEARALLSEAEALNRDIREALSEPGSDEAPASDRSGVEGQSGGPGDSGGDGTGESTVEIDVDAELASIKDELDDANEGAPGTDESDGGDDRDETDG